jgi:hypothetical protein
MAAAPMLTIVAFVAFVMRSSRQVPGARTWRIYSTGDRQPVRLLRVLGAPV